jgi:hypothetical protein
LRHCLGRWRPAGYGGDRSPCGRRYSPARRLVSAEGYRRHGERGIPSSTLYNPLPRIWLRAAAAPNGRGTAVGAKESHLKPDWCRPIAGAGAGTGRRWSRRRRNSQFGKRRHFRRETATEGADESSPTKPGWRSAGRTTLLKSRLLTVEVNDPGPAAVIPSRECRGRPPSKNMSRGGVAGRCPTVSSMLAIQNG